MRRRNVMGAISSPTSAPGERPPERIVAWGSTARIASAARRNRSVYATGSGFGPQNATWLGSFQISQWEVAAGGDGDEARVRHRVLRRALVGAAPTRRVPARRGADDRDDRQAA